MIESSLREIGGYFELELNSSFEIPNGAGYLVNSGRNALELILSALGDIKQVWIPYFTCDVILEPLKKLDIPYSFYHLNEQLELQSEIPLAEGEYLLYTNYYGIKDSYLKTLDTRYGTKLIADNAQALYAKPLSLGSSLYSPRKFVGVADGGIAICQQIIDMSAYETDVSYNRFSHLLKRIDLGAGAAYSNFKENSQLLRNQDIKNMSKLTKCILQTIDYNKVKELRKSNFSRLHQALQSTNELSIDSIDSFECPLLYPYLSSNPELKQHLIDNKVFVPTYWPNVFDWCDAEDYEYRLTKNIIAIPIDQRYGNGDMAQIINIINQKV